MPTVISNIHADYTRRTIQWARIRDALDGQDEIKENGEAYLLKPSGMNNSEYLAYRERAQFYPIAERTLRGMSGLVFRHAARFELPPVLEPLRNDATADGQSLEVLSEDVVNEVLSIGRFGMLLDYPETTTSSNTLPYIATYTAENITDWRVHLIQGRRILTRVVLRDDFDESDEDVNSAAEQRLELLLDKNLNYIVRRWTLSGIPGPGQQEAAWTMKSESTPMVNGAPLKRIPFVFINPYNLKPEVEKPPFLDLVDINVGHYRNSADYEHALYLTAQPTPWVAGGINENNKPTAIGSGAIWLLPEGSSVGMLEFQGAGIAAQRQAMLDKEDRMAALGARMIHDGRNRNESSDTARMRGRSEMSLLTNVVNMVEAGIYKILRMAAEWAGASPDDVKVILNRDWVETKLNAQSLTALVGAWQAGAISHQTLYENLQSGEIAPIARPFDEEKQLIDDEGGDMMAGSQRFIDENSEDDRDSDSDDADGDDS